MDRRLLVNAFVAMVLQVAPASVNAGACPRAFSEQLLYCTASGISAAITSDSSLVSCAEGESQPLHHIAEWWCTQSQQLCWESMSALLDSGASVAALDSQGNTPLHKLIISASTGSCNNIGTLHRAVTLLIGANADTETRNNDGMSSTSLMATLVQSNSAASTAQQAMTGVVITTTPVGGAAQADEDGNMGVIIGCVVGGVVVMVCAGVAIRMMSKKSGGRVAPPSRAPPGATGGASNPGVPAPMIIVAGGVDVNTNP